ncbi:MAG: pilus assembly protein TadG-related protein, partial [Streptosporangiaceae bacterium]
MRDLMASLVRLLQLRLRHDERGVIGAIVAILLGAGVLTGMGVLVLDVGQLYQERAELQNGADAAALAVAKSCALGACTSDVAGQRADGNASRLTQGTEGVSLVCGSGSLGSCPPATGALTS